MPPLTSILLLGPHQALICSRRRLGKTSFHGSIFLRERPLHLPHDMRLAILTLNITAFIRRRLDPAIMILIPLRRPAAIPLRHPAIETLHSENAIIVPAPAPSSPPIPTTRCNPLAAVGEVPRSDLATRIMGTLLEPRVAGLVVAPCRAALACTRCLCGEAVGADHTRFEGVDEEFEEGEAGGDDGSGDDYLAEEGGDPEIVD